MSSGDSKKRWASTIPSARKSIHSLQNNLPLPRYSMDGYGLSSVNFRRNLFAKTVGCQKVDNVLSKPNIPKWRNSHTPEHSEDSFSEDEDYHYESARTHGSLQPDTSSSTDRYRSFHIDESLPKERNVREKKQEQGKGSAMNFVIGAVLSLALAIYSFQNVENSEGVNYDEHQ